MKVHIFRAEIAVASRCRAAKAVDRYTLTLCIEDYQRNSTSRIRKTGDIIVLTPELTQDRIQVRAFEK